MASAYTRPYLDANVYIAAIKGPKTEDPDKVQIAATILQLAEDGAFQIFASTLLAAEVIKVPGDPNPLTPHQENVISGYFYRDFIVMIEVDLLIAEKARQLARDHGLKPPDAVHLATAIRAKCDQFLTWDEKVHRNGRTVEGIYICEPHLTGHQATLFDVAKESDQTSGEPAQEEARS
jgi:predicted nucleic acid-binding protein